MKVIEFLKKAKTFYIATVDGDQPHVRPIGFVMEYNGQLAFYSDSRKSIFKQLQVNPKAEICAVDAQMNTLRLECKVKFITDEASKAAALEAMPMLAKAGYTSGEGPFEIYTIEDVNISFKTISGKNAGEIEL